MRLDTGERNANVLEQLGLTERSQRGAASPPRWGSARCRWGAELRCRLPVRGSKAPDGAQLIP